jgi:peptide chain release factor 1
MEYNKRLFDSCKAIKEKYDELNKQLETAALPMSQLKEVNKQLKHHKPIVEKFITYKKLIDDGQQDEKLLEHEKNQDLIELAKMELEEIKISIPRLEDDIKILLLPVDPNNEKNVIIEMRPAAGGDEASIFVADLFDTYQRYADKQK